ncbi:N-acetyltransferase family protein [Amycolatopsis sp. cg5]|uniref:GNAT family N-acetyltransferase n=1 Tax=Amycolatopsis sp. cg5 TaxID=3238802 RepID=UPI003524FEC5
MPVRDAEVGDLEEICALIEEHAVYEGKDDLRLDRAEMTKHLFGPDPRAWVLIAEAPDAPGRVAGFAFCNWNFSTWMAQPGIWLDDLFIRPEHRRHGLGRELLLALRTRTAGRISWDMQKGNEKAAEFYRRLGAHPVHEWTRYAWEA